MNTNMITKITKKTVRRLLKTVDAGLCSGSGSPTPGEMCVEAAVCYALDLPPGDDPGCVGRAVRRFKINLNDSDWSSNAARAAGMREIAVAQLGSDQIDQAKFVELLALKTIRKLCPLLRQELAKRAKTDEDREAVEAAERTCAVVMSRQAAVNILIRALDLDLDLAVTLARVLDFALVRTLDFDHTLDLDLDLAVTLARFRHARTRFRHALARDETLTILADICLEVLVEMESPGCQWLGLCEEAAV